MINWRGGINRSAALTFTSMKKEEDNMEVLNKYGIEHVGFLVRNLDPVVKHLQEQFPTIEFQFYDYRPLHAWSYGRRVENYHLKIAMGSIPGHDTGLEIIQWVSGDGVHRDFVGSGTGGMHHIAYRVDNYDYWKDHFSKSGVPFIFEAETEDEKNGYRRCFYAWDEVAGMVYEIKEQAHFRHKT